MGLGPLWGRDPQGGARTPVGLTVGPAGIEPTGNMVKQRAEFTVETISAGQGDVLVYVEDPAGHREEVGTGSGGLWGPGGCCG